MGGCHRPFGKSFSDFILGYGSWHRGLERGMSRGALMRQDATSMPFGLCLG